MAYNGSPVALEELVIKTEVSLIDQSLSARRAVEPTNADGFGIGWFGRDNRAGIYRSVRPAWNDANLRDLAMHIESPLFIAHVRRSTGTAVQQSNCHPFRYGHWLFVHNGAIEGFPEIKRELAMLVDRKLYSEIGGTTDSELMFYLALTFGLESDPFTALEITAGVIEKAGHDHGIEYPLHMTLGLADGQRLLAARYSSDGTPPTLFHSASVKAMMELFPGEPRIEEIPEDARAVVSEPLSDVSSLWIEVPPATALEVSGGEVRLFPFEPRLP